MSQSRDFPHIAPEQVTPGQLLMILQSMHAQASVQVAQVTALKGEVEQLRADQRDLLEAWRTSRNVLRFVRLVATFGAALGAGWAAFRGLVR